jgi:two-component system sensor histidine kinase DegS
LRSPTLEHGTLVDALEGLVTRQTNIQARFELRGKAETLSAAIESALLRVCQEALVNVGKHANATQAEVVLEFLPTQVSLSISDDGIGFGDEVLQSPDSVTSGFGLLGMRERIHALGGTLELKSENGARVIATIPYGETKT